ncbi:O-acetylhomoserine sulfhydrylase [Caenispirillum salinarum AK4]|uniref:O-succinylhomoserine sulfhydrylase n=1 Tax=Caenispirillum salinarum AK4 TaxID=1238182 RepID=K9H2V6_9PROT|nr:O-succinylhomoserine sulfhydrylase [Caenispirillum salinarum]EKV32580.1 O-acetylhomoserine sulfhydrylase [Caenispirillum salinarum AK4]
MADDATPRFPAIDLPAAPSADDWAPRTRMVRGGMTRSAFSETSEALYLNSGFVYGSAEEAEASFNGEADRYVYSRFRNPTIEVFETRLALVEGAKYCRATSSGMAAVFAALACTVQAGDRVVASRALFGSCRHIIAEILPTWGVEVEFVHGPDLAAWEGALSKPTTAVFIETPSNPTLEIIDLPRVCDLAHAAGAKVMVDNVFATPILQRPLTLGADVVIYSATKHIDGQGRCLGGAVLTDDEEWFTDRLALFLRHTGPCLSPFNAWVLAKGLETLDLRVDRHCANALDLARFLETRVGMGVARVLYPGLASHPQHDTAMRQMKAGGSIVAVELEGGKDAAFAFLNALRLIDISNNLGDAKSLACHPATTTHASLPDEEKAAQGLTPGLLRLSVGLEDAGDLIRDVERALG